MKKPVRIISLFLILVFIVNCFTGCSLMFPLVAASKGGDPHQASRVGVVVDVGLLAVGAVFVVYNLFKPLMNLRNRNNVSKIENEYLIQQFENSGNLAAADNLFNDDSAFSDAYNSLSETELNSIVQTVNSWDTVNVDFFMASFGTLSEDEIITSVNYFGSLNNDDYKKYLLLNAFQLQLWASTEIKL